MAEHKYPFIPKPYYAAVMFAAKMIRENGYFNKAIQQAAKYYGVDPSELEKHVRARQAAGQKGKKRGSYQYYRYKGKADLYYGETDSFFGTMVFDEVIKATSENNAFKRLWNKLLECYDPQLANLHFDLEIDGEVVPNPKAK